MTDETNDAPVTRRHALAKLGGIAAVFGASALGARELLDTDEAEAAGSGPAGVASGLVTCVLAPEQTEGPYYLDDAAVRRNVTDGKTGVPLTLRLTVVDASTCKPVRRAAVEIWHCDAAGAYSGVQGDSSMFLRGVQRTDAKGLALFRTIYPGWYPGRTVHIHAEPVQQPPEPGSAERGRQHLPKRREALDAQAAAQRDGVRGLDHDGRPALLMQSGGHFTLPLPTNPKPAAFV